MNYTIVKRLQELLGQVDIQEDEWKRLLTGWEGYFEREGIESTQQVETFDDIMRERVQHGSISVLAPGVLDIR